MLTWHGTICGSSRAIWTSLRCLTSENVLCYFVGISCVVFGCLLGYCWGICVAFVGICSDSFEMSKGTILTLKHSPATLPFNLKLENVACLLGKLKKKRVQTVLNKHFPAWWKNFYPAPNSTHPSWLFNKPTPTLKAFSGIGFPQKGIFLFFRGGSWQFWQG